MSAYGTKRTYRLALHMSAFGGKSGHWLDGAIVALHGHFGDGDVADVAKLADQAGSKGRKVAQPLALAATTYRRSS
jgi:hypothetical protein